MADCGSVDDEVLVGLADIMKSSCGARDIAGRYGGEEFCLAVVGYPERDLETLAERRRQAVAGVRGWLPNGEAVTISVGIASLVTILLARLTCSGDAERAAQCAVVTGRCRIMPRAVRPCRSSHKIVDGAMVVARSG
jgi:diguanylate cyclase (GGDEF)-like protein